MTDSDESAAVLAYWKNLLTTRTTTLRERAERAEAENERLRAAHPLAPVPYVVHDGVVRQNTLLLEALRRACNDAWSDPEGAMQHYLSGSEGAPNA